MNTPGTDVDPETISGSFVPVARPVASVELDGETVLYYDPSGNFTEPAQMHLLNPTAGVMWACFDGSGSLDEIGADLAAAYGIPREEAAAAAVGLARQLGHAGLLVGVAADPPPDQPVSGWMEDGAQVVD